MFQFEHFLIRNAQMYPNRLAFVYKDKSYTWSELNRAVNRLANSFTSIGLGKGDRVAYMFGNCAEVVLVFLATQKIGRHGHAHQHPLPLRRDLPHHGRGGLQGRCV